MFRGSTRHIHSNYKSLPCFGSSDFNNILKLLDKAACYLLSCYCSRLKLASSVNETPMKRMNIPLTEGNCTVLREYCAEVKVFILMNIMSFILPRNFPSYPSIVYTFVFDIQCQLKTIHPSRNSEVN